MHKIPLVSNTLTSCLFLSLSCSLLFCLFCGCFTCISAVSLHYTVYYDSFHCTDSFTGNYTDSLVDATFATRIQPSYLKAIIRGEFCQELYSDCSGLPLKTFFPCGQHRLYTVQLVWMIDDEVQCNIQRIK